MSVDDILSNPLLSMKRRRKVRDSHGSSSSVASGGGRSSKSSLLQKSVINPGEGERKKRLEQLQREKLIQREKLVQRRLIGQQSSERGRKLYEAYDQEQPNKEEGKGILDNATSSYDKHRDFATTTTTTTTTSTSNDVTSTVTATTVTTYSLPELSSSRSSTDVFTVAATSSGTTGKFSAQDSVEKESDDHDGIDDTINFDDYHDDTTQHPPNTVESALSSLHSKYESCTAADDALKQQGQDEKEEEKITKASKAAASPWSVIQALPRVLHYTDLKRHTISSSDFDQTKSMVELEKRSYIQKELSKVIISVTMMKRKVMNRNNGLVSTGINIDEEETAAQQTLKKEASILLMIQIQVWIRMMMWSLEGETGWTYLEEIVKLTEDQEDTSSNDGKKRSKKQKKKKVKKGRRKEAKVLEEAKADEQTPRQALVEHLTTLFELIPYVLPPSMDFSAFVKDTLTFGHRQNIPEYGAEVLDHFEIEIVEPIVLKRSGTDASQRSNRSEISYSPVKKATSNDVGSSPSREVAEKRAKRQQAYFASLMEEKSSTSVNADDESATITGSISTVTSTSRGSKRSRGPDVEKDDAKLLKTSVSLTAALKPKGKENPFLKGSARGTYVGSHLSSKLSNISTLFREVTVPVKKPKKKTSASSASLLANSKKSAKGKVDDAGLKAPFNITARVTREQRSITQKTHISQTPTKKSNANGISSYLGGADSYPNLSTPRPRRIIEETPAKSRRLVISETPQQQPRFRRQQLDLNTSRLQQEKRVRNWYHTNSSLSPMIQYGGLSPMPQKKDVIADAAKAAARKRK